MTASIAELERANAGKDAFMAAVSHELRTPLVGILSMSEVLQSQARGPLNPDQERYVETVRESGERLLATVNGVLLYTGLMTGAANLHQERCRLSDLCASSIRAVQARTMRKSQHIALDVAPKDLELYSDADAITNLVAMLLDNAVKFTPSSGQIGVRAAHDADARFVRLEVWDTGIGMTDAQLAHVFRPFAQADQGLTRQFAGTGIGLAYVNQVVTLLGGTVTVESAPDQGSRFIVRLPANVEEIGT